jgi:serpin B
MITRRDVFRGLGLSVLAVGTVGLLDACGDEPSPGPPPGAADLTLASSEVERAAPDPGAVAAGVASMHALGAGLWGELSGDDGNLAISPFSVAVALGMTVDGAKGATLDEMLSVLGVDSAEQANTGYNSVGQYVESLAGPVKRPEIPDDDAEIVLDTANSLFGQSGVTWGEQFLDALAASYGAGMQQVDYRTAPEDARELINDWTADQTRDKIPELLGQGTITTDTRLVLVNALYLKAPWNVPFESSLTEDGDFQLADGKTVSVPMMHKPDAYGATGPGWQSAALRYAGDELMMTVVLADDPDALVASGGLADVLASESFGSVDLTMPRWTFRAPSSLGAALSDLGMPTAFGPGADLSAMTRDEHLEISAVVHEVYIAVDEKGTEAAAATAVLAVATSAGPPPAEMVCDRPFLFVIHDVELGTPLFVGRVGDPSGS